MPTGLLTSGRHIIKGFLSSAAHLCEKLDMVVNGAEFWAVESDSAAGNSGPVCGALLNGGNLLTWLHVTTAHSPEAIMITAMIKYIEAH